jgi:hypothetical protein
MGIVMIGNPTIFSVIEPSPISFNMLTLLGIEITGNKDGSKTFIDYIKDFHQQAFIIFVFGTLVLIQFKKVLIGVISAIGSGFKSAVIVTYFKIRRVFLFAMANIERCLNRIKRIPAKISKFFTRQEE